jgi:hypothetical protein
MLRFSPIKTALIVSTCLLGALLAVPNFIATATLPAWLPHPRVNLGLGSSGRLLPAPAGGFEDRTQRAADQQPL